jgi:hypothetical protein
MRIDLVGDSYQAWSLPFNSERTVNLFPVFNRDGRDIAALYGTAGLSLFTTLGVGSVRGGFKSNKNGRVFFVSSNIVYEVEAGGTSTNRGNLDQSSGNITISENETQMAICDGVSVYIFTYSSNAFAKVTDPDLPSVGTITTMNNYFVVNENDTGKYYISAVGDGTSWNALDFKSAETSPDSIRRVFNAVGQLWCFGESTTELFSNTGASDFPFEKVSSGDFEIGILAPYSIQAIGNTLFWLGQDRYGRGIVYETTSITPTPISTPAIDILLQEATNPEEIVSWVYQEKGFTFYVLTGGGLRTSLVYNVTNKLWHERAYTNQDGDFEQHRGRCCVFAFGKQLVGDRENGNIYEMDMDIYSDNGEDIVRERIYKHLFNEGDRLRFNCLEIGVETGVGLQNGQGSNPKIALSLSKDSGQSYGTPYTEELGKAGNYFETVRFRGLGVAESMTFKIRISDQVKVALFGSYLKDLGGER